MHAEEALSQPAAQPQAPRRSVIALVLTFALGVTAGLVVGRSLRPQEPVSTATSRARPGEATAQRVRMSELLRERAGIETTAARRRTLTPTIDAIGSVDFDRDRVAEVGSRIEGRVARVLVGVGATVRPGDALVEIESAVVSEALAAYVSAQAGLVAARAEDARLARLAADHLVTAREVEQQHALLITQEAAQRGALQRLMAAGLSQAEVQQLARAPGVARVTLRAPIAGRVVSRDVTLGQVVEPTTTVLQIADPSRLWVQLEVFERDLGRVTVGSTADVQTDAHPDVVYRGAVTHIATAVNHATRTARVRIEVESADGALRPGHFVRARLRAADGASREAVTIARDAVVQVEGRPAGFVAVRDGEYELRPLELGVTDGDEVEVLRGVDAGEAVVTRGAFALKSELLR